MLVHTILRTKGASVVTIPADATVRRLLDVLAEHSIGAAVVSADGRHADGIVSERDVVRCLRVDGSLLEKSVASIMTTDVATCTPTATVEDLMEVMTRRRIRHVPVVDGDALVGLVSIGDVVKSRINELEGERDDLVSYIGAH